MDVGKINLVNMYETLYPNACDNVNCVPLGGYQLIWPLTVYEKLLPITE